LATKREEKTSSLTPIFFSPLAPSWGMEKEEEEELWEVGMMLFVCLG